MSVSDDIVERLSLMVAADVAPVITDRLEDILALCVVGDPDDDPVAYDFNKAAELCWLRRAAMTASGFDFSVEGKSFSRSQAFEHYTALAAQYARKRLPASLPLQPRPRRCGICGCMSGCGCGSFDWDSLDYPDRDDYGQLDGLPSA